MGSTDRECLRKAAFFAAFLAPFLGGCGSPRGAVPPPVVEEESAIREIVLPPSSLETCRNGLDDNQNGLLDEGCSEGPASVLEFVLAWSDAEVDLNLWVVDADGDVVDVGNVSGLGLTKQNDCPSESLCQGQNYERVYLDRGASKKFDRVRILVEVTGRLPETRDYPFSIGVRDGKGTRAFVGAVRPERLRVERELEVEVRVVEVETKDPASPVTGGAAKGEAEPAGE